MAFQVDKGKIAKNTIALYLRIGITMVISFFTSRVTLEQLGVQDYGLNNLVGSIVSMLTFLQGSMGTAVQRFFSIEIGKGNDSALKKIFGVGLSLHIIVAIITLIIGEIFAVFFLDKMNIPAERQFAAQVIFQISLASLIISIVNVPYAALLRARELFSKTATIEIVIAFLRLLVIYLLIIIDYDKLIVLSSLNFCISVFYVVCLTVLALKFKESHTLPLWETELVKKMLSFISMLILTVLAELAKVKGLVFLINLFFGLVINAAYAVAVQVSNIVKSFTTSFKQAVVPQMMSAYGSGDMKTMHALIDTGTKITFLLLCLITLPVIFEVDFMLKIWLKTPPEYASELVVLVMIYLNISSYTYFHYQGVHATGNITKQQVFVSSLYVLNILIIWGAFKLGFNFYSAIYVNMIISVAQCIVNLIFAKRYYEYNVVKFLKETVAPSLVLVAVVVSTLWLEVKVMSDSWIRFVIVVTTSSALISTLGYLILLNSSEKGKVKLYIRKLVKK